MGQFKAEDHLIDIKGKKYLPVASRLVWFREEHPDWGIKTGIAERIENGAIMKAEILDNQGNVIAQAHKMETKSGFGDYLEKAETGAVGRALATCGYGTQFSPDLEEGSRLADSPISFSKENRSGDNLEAHSPQRASRKGGGNATLKQLQFIMKIYKENGADTDAMLEKVRDKYGVQSHKELTIEQASEWIGMLKENPKTTMGFEDVDSEEIPDFTDLEV